MGVCNNDSGQVSEQTFSTPAPAVGIDRIGKSLLISCSDSCLYCFNSKVCTLAACHTWEGGECVCVCAFVCVCVCLCVCACLLMLALTDSIQVQIHTHTHPRCTLHLPGASLVAVEALLLHHSPQSAHLSSKDDSGALMTARVCLCVRLCLCLCMCV